LILQEAETGARISGHCLLPPSSCAGTGSSRPGLGPAAPAAGPAPDGPRSSAASTPSPPSSASSGTDGSRASPRSTSLSEAARPGTPAPAPDPARTTSSAPRPGDARLKTAAAHHGPDGWAARAGTEERRRFLLPDASASVNASRTPRDFTDLVKRLAVGPRHPPGRPDPSKVLTTLGLPNVGFSHIEIPERLLSVNASSRRG
jgi:hypothetical protein